MRQLRDILCFSVLVLLVAWAASPMIGFADVGPPRVIQGMLHNPAVKATNLTGTPISAVSVSATPVLDSWVITFGPSGDTLVAYATGGAASGYAVTSVLAAEGDTLTTLISGLQVILADSVATTDMADIQTFIYVPMRAMTDSTLEVTAKIASFPESTYINFIAVDSAGAASLVSQDWDVNTGYDDSLVTKSDPLDSTRVFSWALNAIVEALGDSIKVWVTHAMDVNVTNATLAATQSGAWAFTLSDSALVYVSHDLPVALQDSAAVYSWALDRIAEILADSLKVYVSHDLPVAVQDSAAVHSWALDAIVGALSESLKVYVSHPMETTNADTVYVRDPDEAIRRSPAYTNSFPDSGGAGTFHYIVDLSAHDSLLVRTPTTGNQIILDGLSFDLIGTTVANQDTVQFAIAKGAVTADSLWWRRLIPDNYGANKNQLGPYPFKIYLAPDSALVVKSANGVAAGEDILRVYIPGVEMAAP